MCQYCGDPDHMAEWLQTDNQGATTSSETGFATGGSTVTATGVTDVDGLLGGIRWNNQSVDFNFPTLQSYYTAPYGTALGSDGVTQVDLSTTFVAVSESFKAMVRHALGEFSAVTNLTFNEVASTATSNISVGRTAGLGSGSALGFTGYGYFPGSSQRAGDIWFSSSTADVGDTFVMGRGTYALVVHELGHAMGLKHGHQLGGVANTAMTAAHDFNDYSVMSYRREMGGATSGLSSEAFGRPQTLMMYDILALQTMYGANYTTNSTNTVYTFSTTTGQMFVNGVGGDIPGNGAANSNRIYRTLWDGGGTDTYDFSNYTTNLSVDLTPGGRSTLDQAQLAIVNSATGGRATGNLFNALQFNGDARSLIENAIGGLGTDQITGNAADNALSGGANNDTLNGGTGSDTLDGGTGTDTMVGGDGGDFYVVDATTDVVTETNADVVTGGFDYVTSSANYTLTDNVEELILVGGATTGTGSAGDNVLYGLSSGLALTLNGKGGNDVIYGSAVGGNTLTGEAGVDTMLMYGGNNTANGGTGSDIYYTYVASDVISEAGGDGIDTVYSAHSLTVAEDVEQVILFTTSATSATSNSLDDNNIMYGNSVGASVTLNGGGGADVLFGGAFADNLTGGDGVDLLFGFGGANVMNGGADTDVYYIESGLDIIADTGQSGTDTIYSQIAGTTTISSGVEQLILYGAATGAIGSSSADFIFGHIASQAVTLEGREGNDYLLDSTFSGDTLNGGSGGNQLDLRTGGNDFIDYRSAGTVQDIVFGFEAGVTTGQQDLILVTGRGLSATSIGSAITITAAGANTIVRIGDDFITFVGVTSTNISASDFVF